MKVPTKQLNKKIKSFLLLLSRYLNNIPSKFHQNLRPWSPPHLVSWCGMTRTMNLVVLIIQKRALATVLLGYLRSSFKKFIRLILKSALRLFACCWGGQYSFALCSLNSTEIFACANRCVNHQRARLSRHFSNYWTHFWTK